MRLEAKLLEQLNKSNGKPPKLSTKSRGRSTIQSAASQRIKPLQKQGSVANMPDNQTSRNQVGSTTRKTREQKMIEDIQKEKEQYEKMLKVKIEDKRMTKPLDVSIISAQTIEGLLKFIQLQPDDSKQVMDQKLNKQRIEVQGQKPNKVKMNLAHQNTLQQEAKEGEDMPGQ